MTIIAVLNPKGGSGKTTLSTNLVRAFHERGSRVLLVDSDPQGSASDWHAAREDNPIPLLAYGRPENMKALPDVARPYDIVVIDGAAKLEGMIAAAVKLADVVLIPVQPSPYDIWAASDLVDLVGARREVTGGKPKAAFVISRAIKRTRLGHEVGTALAEYGLPVFEAGTTQRQAYPRTASVGQTVFDEGETEAAREIEAVADEAMALMEGGNHAQHQTA
ncbi:AAA family ATPase [Acuticoccus sp. M5D2P5]|uniref:ParA family partition ATPase n=1 Tax=Acuticoccus kalidii TaxID=2910977 RepID=UPI001F26D35F|nr:ParA family partition ATPase [Acuticoccus kalidii]MCF3931807.1 AAA family ATPase [Acuticoccus kalidii]